MPVFSEPLQWDDAVRQLRRKRLLPTTLSSAELRELGGEVQRRAFLMARVSDAEFLQRAKNLLEEIVGEERFASVPEARVALKDYLDSIDYKPAAKGIQDLSSDARLNLMLRTNIETAFGYGRHRDGQSETVLAVWPAQELYRAMDRKEPRDWEQRWEDADGELTDDGRMIALKDDDIWQALGDGAGGYDDTLGNPYPPFAFNSGMRVRNISRAEAIEYGVMDEDTVVEPDDSGLNDALGVGMALLSGDIEHVLLQSLGDGYEVVEGVLRLID